MSGRKIYEVVNEGSKIELYGNEGGDPETFVEGIHGFTISGGNVKMNLYTIAPDSTPQLQRREVVGRIVMPIAQFMQFVQFANNQAAQIQEAIIQAQQEVANADGGAQGAESS